MFIRFKIKNTKEKKIPQTKLIKLIKHKNGKSLIWNLTTNKNSKSIKNSSKAFSLSNQTNNLQKTSLLKKKKVFNPKKNFNFCSFIKKKTRNVY